MLAPGVGLALLTALLMAPGLAGAVLPVLPGAALVLAGSA